MVTRKGGSNFPSLLDSCVLWAPLQHSAGVSGDIDEFPIIPSGVTVTNNGTFTKTSLGNNKSVLNFDGSTNYISLSNNASFNFGSGNFTICFWVKIFSLPASKYSYFFWYGSDTNLIGMQVNASNGNIYWYAKNNSTYLWDLHVGTLSLNTWTHITCLRNGNYQASYINGVKSGGTGSGTGAVGTYTNPFMISNCPYAYGNPNQIKGNIKDLMIFKDRALSQPEIKLLMNRTHPETGAGLMPANGEYYKLS